MYLPAPLLHTQIVICAQEMDLFPSLPPTAPGAGISHHMRSAASAELPEHVGPASAARSLKRHSSDLLQHPAEMPSGSTWDRQVLGRTHALSALTALITPLRRIY